MHGGLLFPVDLSPRVKVCGGELNPIKRARAAQVLSTGEDGVKFEIKNLMAVQWGAISKCEEFVRGTCTFVRVTRGAFEIVGSDQVISFHYRFNPYIYIRFKCYPMSRSIIIHKRIEINGMNNYAIIINTNCTEMVKLSGCLTWEVFEISCS